MAVASYGSATKSSGVVRILKDLDAAIEGRDVLIVEDIVDSGLTLQYLLRNLEGAQPRLARGLRAADQAGAAQGRPHDPLCRLRDPQPVRDRLRARPRRALPQPALRRGVESVVKAPPHQGCLALSTAPNAGATLAKSRHDADKTPGPARPRDPSHEQVLQERRIPDSDRGRACVLRPEADRQLEPRARTTRSATSLDAARQPRGQVDDARPEGQQRSTSRSSERRPSTRSATRTRTRRR